MSKPPRSDPNWAPGARNRFDDFVAVHINQTLYIHGTVCSDWKTRPIETLLILLARGTSSPGTAISPGPMRMLCVQSVATMDTSHTGHGTSTLPTPSTRPSLTAPSTACLVMATSFHTMAPLRLTIPSSHRVLVEVVSATAPSPSKLPPPRFAHSRIGY